MSIKADPLSHPQLLEQLQAASNKIKELAAQLDQQVADAAGRVAAALGAAGLVMEEPVRPRPAPAGDWAPHQKRVINEKRELDDRREKLDSFLETATFAQLDDSEQGRMHAQRDAMADYSRVLGERIAAFTVPAEAWT